MDYGLILARSDDLKLKKKNILMMDLLLKNASFRFTRMDWSGVDYCDVFISCWTLILTAPIHCRGSIGEQVM